MTKTAFVWEELYMWHDTGHYAGVLEPDPAMFIEPDEHSENPKTKRRLKNLLDVAGVTAQLHHVPARTASDEDILRVHSKEYLDRLTTLSEEHGGDAGGLSPFGRGGVDVARLSAGGCLAIADAIMAGEADNGYALNRPPGHHACADTGMGFCMFSNGSIVAKHLISKHGLSRIAIVDWDVHHGNGPQGIFYDDPSVLTISVHQDNCFPPESGPVDETGEGDGNGTNINIPLPPGSGRGAYYESFEKVVLPALDAFKPEFILVASGFDGAGQDPLGRNMLYSTAYAKLTHMLLDAAEKLCGGRLMMTHEGGYSPSVVPFCGLAVIEALSGIDSGVTDPFAPLIAGMGYQDTQPHQQAVIDRAAENLALMPVIEGK